MGLTQSNIYLNFEDVVSITEDNKMKFTMIHTLDISHEEWLIEGTLNAKEEEHYINECIYRKFTNDYIVIYGKNNIDKSVSNKYNQLIQLGFTNVFIYPGGLFEWLLLQDIYGNEIFKTKNKVNDFLQYKPESGLNSI